MKNKIVLLLTIIFLFIFFEKDVGVTPVFGCAPPDGCQYARCDGSLKPPDQCSRDCCCPAIPNRSGDYCYGVTSGSGTCSDGSGGQCICACPGGDPPPGGGGGTSKVAFNGIVQYPVNNRWSPGSNCASRLGVSISSSKGGVNWKGDASGGHFDVVDADANSSVTVTLTPASGCGLACGTWVTTDGSASGSGCVATFTTASSDWARNVYFTMAPSSICGYIYNSYPTPSPVANYNVTVFNSRSGATSVTSDASGKFSTAAGFVLTNDYYAVRAVSAPPSGYISPSKSTTAGFSWQSPSGPDTPLNSVSYEYQMFGNYDCSNDFAGSGNCRCNFKFNFAPKTCSIVVSEVSPGNINVALSGRGTIAATESVRLFLDTLTGTTLPSPPGGTTLNGPYGGYYYYNAGSCSSVSGNICTGNFSITNIPEGDYYLHCDLASDPPPTKCSGNPFCNYERPAMPGGIDCSSTGWVSCSANDNARISIVVNHPPSVASLEIRNNAGVAVNKE